MSQAIKTINAASPRLEKASSLHGIFPKLADQLTRGTASVQRISRAATTAADTTTNCILDRGRHKENLRGWAKYTIASAGKDPKE